MTPKHVSQPRDPVRLSGRRHRAEGAGGGQTAGRGAEGGGHRSCVVPVSWRRRRPCTRRDVIDTVPRPTDRHMKSEWPTRWQWGEWSAGVVAVSGPTPWSRYDVFHGTGEPFVSCSRRNISVRLPFTCRGPRLCKTNSSHMCASAVPSFICSDVALVTYVTHGPSFLKTQTRMDFNLKYA